MGLPARFVPVTLDMQVLLQYLSAEPEVANELGVDLVTAKVRAHRADKRLRSGLAAVG